ncbi:MAG: chemotaxis-specific protein-glutamate methyltransferase CheB [Lachnospiraceae bacterium]|nr:chemotaxis-specific protein-glutamate methyltransferase CheB [Lachnospiraceae bacterium]
MKNIMIVDDSALMRRVFSDIINGNEKLQVKYLAKDGVEALELLDSGIQVDAIVLDINMPRMNGIEFLRTLRKKGRREKVLIVSTLAHEDGKETIEALELGAFDFVTKPTNLAEAKGITFGLALTRMLYIATGLAVEDLDMDLSEVAKRERQKAVSPKKPLQMQHVTTRQTAASALAGKKGDCSTHSKKPMGRGARKIIALACSTGGPKALQSVIPKLPADLDAAIVLVQHMPEGFTGSLAKRLDELSAVHVKEAADGDILEKGTVYIAKGGYQMKVVEKGKQHSLAVVHEAPRNALRPCADIMYESLMRSSFDEITCVVMTGMGADGTQGILQLEKTNKIYVIAQDEASSIVYGMPKAIAQADAVDEVVTLGQIAESITKHVGVR